MAPFRVAVSRRQWLSVAFGGAAGLASQSRWLPLLAQQAASQQPKRACILLWMAGGPSQMDTFDLKPGHKNGGEFQEIETTVPGIRICEHLPKLAQLMDHVALVRSMKTREGDHARGTYLMRTGYLPQGPIQYPTLGSLLSKELGDDESSLPNFVSIAPNTFLSPGAFGPGFLGSKYAPLVVGGAGPFPTANPNPDDNADISFRVENLSPVDGASPQQRAARLDLLRSLDDEFSAQRRGIVTESHRSAYNAAVRMMSRESEAAFRLDDEPAPLRDAYGRNPFGQGCLLARRLVERGVPFVEISLNGVGPNGSLGWDTHADNFNAVKQLSAVLDPAWATLMSDLKDRGLLESTLVVWMGEFGRTPKINNNAGRDHFPAAWSTALCGGGIRGGQVVGKTSPDGMRVEDRPVNVGDLIATICRGVGLDPSKQNLSSVGRPIRLAEPSSQPIEELL
jgi:uncharacterized protein (DUF1501 family)